MHLCLVPFCNCLFERKGAQSENALTTNKGKTEGSKEEENSEGEAKEDEARIFELQGCPVDILQHTNPHVVHIKFCRSGQPQISTQKQRCLVEGNQSRRRYEDVNEIHGGKRTNNSMTLPALPIILTCQFY